jgi:hypothetical protein
MAKQQANGYIKVVWVLEADIADPEFPTAAELNAALDLSSAISWEDYALGSTGSDDIEDRALTDLGNATSRGSANYEAVLDFFRDKNNQDATSVYVDAFEAFRTFDVVGYLVTRVNDKPATDAFAAGDTVSVFKVIISHTTDITSGDTSTKFQVTFLSQGSLFTHTTVAGAGSITVASTLALAVGEAKVLTPTLAGKSIRSRATYTSASPDVARVSSNGAVVGVSAGTAVITTAYGAGTSGTTTVTVSP